MESNRSFYDRVSRVYDLIADRDEHEAREAGERALELKPGERVLELGFGTGNSVVNLARAVGEGGRVSAVDVSPGMRDVALAKVQQAGLSDVAELTVGDARELPFETAAFDAVFTSFTLELFEEHDIPRVLAEAARVLRSGGRLGVVAMNVVDHDEHPSLMERAYVWMHRHFPHIVDCRPIDTAGKIAAAGFRVVRSDRLQIWTMPVAIVVANKP